MIVRIDTRRLVDEAHLHHVLNEAFGFPESYGANMDALIDCLTYLDDPGSGMTRIQVFPGQVVLLVLEHVAHLQGLPEMLRRTLEDAVAFVNGRRLEHNQPPVLAIAHDLRD